jgi:predicted esterase
MSVVEMSFDMRKGVMVLVACVVVSPVLFFIGRALWPVGERTFEIPGCPYPCVISVPSDYVPGTRLPLILFLHGYGGSPTTWPFKSATGGKGYFICGLSYGALAGGDIRNISKDEAKCLEMEAFIEQVRAHLDRCYGIDQRRVYLAGFSTGGWAVSYFGLRKEDLGRYRGYVVIGDGVHNDGGIDLSVAKGVPILLVHGEDDPNGRSAEASMPLLENAGAFAKHIVLTGQGHVPTGNVLDVPLRAWLDEVEKHAMRDRPLP